MATQWPRKLMQHYRPLAFFRPSDIVHAITELHQISMTNHRDDFRGFFWWLFCVVHTTCMDYFYHLSSMEERNSYNVDTT